MRKRNVLLGEKEMANNRDVYLVVKTKVKSIDIQRWNQINGSLFIPNETVQVNSVRWFQNISF